MRRGAPRSVRSGSPVHENSRRHESFTTLAVTAEVQSGEAGQVRGTDAVTGNIADHLVVMQQGRIGESGVANTVLRHPRSPHTKTLLAAVSRIQSTRQ